MSVVNLTWLYTVYAREGNTKVRLDRISGFPESSLGPVVNILAIFSNAYIVKNKRIKIYHIKGIGCPLLISINIDHF